MHLKLMMIKAVTLFDSIPYIELLEESVKFSEVHKSNNLSSYDDEDEKVCFDLQIKRLYYKSFYYLLKVIFLLS